MAVAGDLESAVAVELDHGVGILPGAVPFDHGLVGVVMDAVDDLVLAFVLMAVEDGVDAVFAGFKNFPDGGGISNAQLFRIGEELVAEDEDRFAGGPEFIPEPLQLPRGNVGIGPGEVSPVVGNAVGTEVGVEDDAVASPGIESVEGAVAGDSGVLDNFLELGLGNAVDVVVAEDMIARALEPGKDGFDVAKEGEGFLLDPAGSFVLEVARFDDKGEVLRIHIIDTLIQLGNRLPVIAGPVCVPVGVVGVGKKAETQERKAMGTRIGGGPERSGAGDDKGAGFFQELAAGRLEGHGEAEVGRQEAGGRREEAEGRRQESGVSGQESGKGKDRVC